MKLCDIIEMLSHLTAYFFCFYRECVCRVYSISDRVHLAIPYVSQYTSPSLSGKFEAGRLSLEYDPVWKRSGAKSKQEYALWAFNMCGMACTAMVLDYLKINHSPLVAMGKQCAEYGGYHIHNDTIEGLFHYPYRSYLHEEFSLNASVIPFITMRRILFELSNGVLFISSVHPSIKDKDAQRPKTNGGHLVIVTGYDCIKHTITIHNPSGLYRKSQKYYQLSWKEFSRFFAGRGILVYPFIEK